MTDTQHTPEPWVVVSLYRTAEDVQSGNPYVYSVGPRGSRSLDCEKIRDPQRAERIVACVNALEGYATEDIEAVGACLDWDGESAELAALREVAEAATEVARVAEIHLELHDLEEVKLGRGQALRAALAKLGGSTFENRG